jgi:16S rRNA (cytidine1402-2'-O)-methyltransferase
MPEASRWVRPGVLYLVATPIGNLSDLSPRAQEVLRDVDRVVAEDTRVTGRLLKHLGINAPLLSLHAHSGPDRVDAVLSCLGAGEAVALVSDAGLPAVSDPGRELVEAAWGRDIPVCPIPGPSAGVTAFAASGFDLPWVQWGFVPARGRDRADRLREVLTAPGAQVLYEAPHRVARLLADLVDAGAGARTVVLAREITKLHEEWWRGTVEAAAARLAGAAPPRGEWTVVVGPQPRPTDGAAAPDWAAALEAVRRLVDGGCSGSEACRAVADRAGVGRRELYRRWHAETRV